VATIDRYLGKVFCGDALDLLRTMPVESVDAVIADAMYGTSKKCQYEWGVDPAKGDPVKHWHYHEPIYRECLRVLRPGGILAWGQGAKFCQHFRDWFGGYRVWTLTRFRLQGLAATGHVWIVQTREQQPVEFPTRDSLVIFQNVGPLRKLHPCIKPPEEPAFLIESLTQPGQVVLDCFCRLGSTLLACQRLRRSWIGCDLSRAYCRVALRRLRREARPGQPERVTE
jgi:DNA modification methylase